MDKGWSFLYAAVFTKMDDFSRIIARRWNVDRATADDLCAKGFDSLVAHRQSWADFADTVSDQHAKAAIAKWFLVACHREARKQLLDAKKAVPLDDSLYELPLRHVANQEVCVDALAVVAVVARLPGDLSDVVLMMVDGLDLEEMAMELGEDVNVVRMKRTDAVRRTLAEFKMTPLDLARAARGALTK